MLNRSLPLALLFTASSAAAQIGPTPTAQPTPTTQPSPQVLWQTHDVTDGSPNYGRYASVAVTETNCTATIGGWTVSYRCPLIGVAHFNATNSDLMYSSSTDGGETFTTVTVDNRNGDILGHFPALAYRDDQPVIAYRNATQERLYFATPTTAGSGNCGTGSNWRCRDLGYGGIANAITVHSDGRVIIATYESVRGIFLKEAPPPYSSFTSRDVASYHPLSMAVAIDDIAQVHVAWAGTTCARYTYGTFETVETIECAEQSPVANSGGLSMKLNQYRRPHVAYSTYSAANGHRIRRAWKSDYQTWNRETISSLGVAPQPGMSILMTESGSGTEAIAWGGTSSYGNPRLYVARAGSSWSITAASPTGGAYPNLFHYGDALGAIHYDAVNMRLLFSDND